MSFGDRTRPQNLDWTAFYDTSAELVILPARVNHEPRARHEPTSSQAQMFYINCRNNLTGNMKYVIAELSREARERSIMGNKMK